MIKTSYDSCYYSKAVAGCSSGSTKVIATCQAISKATSSKAISSKELVVIIIISSKAIQVVEPVLSSKTITSILHLRSIIVI